MLRRSSVDDYSFRFGRAFPTLPPFSAYIASISTTPAPYRDIIPPILQASNQSRQIYLDALIWLLKMDLVVQVHSRARIFARPEVKAKAWTKLWHRRRNRWLASHVKGNVDSPTSEVLDDMITPRAGDNATDPMEVTIPPSGGMDSSYMDYDPDLEMDSDLGEGEDANTLQDMKFEMGVEEPDERDVPVFHSTFIFKPARAQKDEARWLRVIREGVKDEVWASKFDLYVVYLDTAEIRCVQYLDGIATFEEITYRTGLHRRELDKIVQLFKDDVSVAGTSLSSQLTRSACHIPPPMM
jgi:hypothetical protein